MPEERVTRRLAAILVADVVGYSKLIGGDESGTLTQLDALRTEVIEPQIAKHAGRLFKAVGDGFLVEFASAVQAVICARAIQNTNEQGRLPLRIGIHVGDVVIQGDDLMGDAVNVAARVEGIAEPGGIAITRSVHEQVRDKLDLGFTDKGEVELKNIQRPIQVFVIAGARVDGKATVLALPDKPSIAVLPFQSMSGDPEQEYFADGMVEDIITELSKLKSLFVIARNSSFSYKGRSPDIRQVGQELGVRYVLEGSVRRGGERLRVTAQLIEASSGSHIWAERYDRALAEVFELQDELTGSIVRHLMPQLTAAEVARSQRKDAKNLTSWDLYLQALPRIRSNAKEEVKAAELLLRQAVAAEPNFAAAHAKLSSCRLKAAYFAWEDSAVPLDEAFRHARVAIALDPEDGLGFDALASALQRRGDLQEAVANAQKAIELSPALMAAHGTLVSSLAQCGRVAEAIAAFKVSERLSPRDPERSGRLMGLLIAKFFNGEYVETIRLAEEHILLQPNWYGSWAYLASSLALLGRIEEAREAALRIVKLKPDYTLTMLQSTRMFGREEDRQKLIQGLRQAGLPN